MQVSEWNNLKNKYKKIYSKNIQISLWKMNRKKNVG